MTVLQPSCPNSAGCCCCPSSEGRAQAAAAAEDQISAAKTEAEWTKLLEGGELSAYHDHSTQSEAPIGRFICVNILYMYVQVITHRNLCCYIVITRRWRNLQTLTPPSVKPVNGLFHVFIQAVRRRLSHSQSWSELSEPITHSLNQRNNCFKSARRSFKPLSRSLNYTNQSCKELIWLLE